MLGGGSGLLNAQSYAPGTLGGRGGLQLGAQPQVTLPIIGQQQPSISGQGQRPSNLSLGTGLQQGGLGLGFGLGQQTSFGTGLGQQAGLGTGFGLKPSLGPGLGQQTGLGTGLGLQTSLGTGLGQQAPLGQQQGGLNLGLGQKSLLGYGQQQQQQAGFGFGSGLQTSTVLGGTGSRTQSGLGFGSGLGTGTQASAGTGLNFGLGGIGQAPTQAGAGLGLGLGQAGFGTGGQGAKTTTLGTGPTGGQAPGAVHVPTVQGTPNEMAQVFLNAITLPGIFGDERDVVIKKFNQLQAYCGTGKGLTAYAGQVIAVDFGPENIFAKFKTICYSRLPSIKNEDGLVALQFKRTQEELLRQQEPLTKSLQDIVGQPTVQVKLDTVRPLPDNCAEVTIYILEQSAMGSMRRVHANNTYMHLSVPTRRAQLEKLGAISMYPKTGFNEQELKIYLANPPLGIPLEVWEESKKKNPDPEKYIPVAVMSSADLLMRAKQQQQECSQQRARIKLMAEEVCQLRQQHSTTVARITEYRRRLNNLRHRVLQVMVIQEKLRKSGWSVQLVEEQLRSKLEAIQMELDSPTLIKGKLNELMSQVRMQAQSTSYRGNSKFSLDSVMSHDLEEHLSQLQGALAEMVKIIQQDFKDLKLIQTGLQDEMKNPYIK